MTHRSPPPRRRRGELTRISAAASKHPLSAGPFRGRPVGALETAVLEDIRAQLGEQLKKARVAELEADLRAINEERERRWLAFTS